MSQPIDKITLKGFKSIRSLEDFFRWTPSILMRAQCPHFNEWIAKLETLTRGE